MAFDVFQSVTPGLPKEPWIIPLYHIGSYWIIPPALPWTSLLNSETNIPLAVLKTGHISIGRWLKSAVTFVPRSNCLRFVLFWKYSTFVCMPVLIISVPRGHTKVFPSDIQLWCLWFTVYHSNNSPVLHQKIWSHSLSISRWYCPRQSDYVFRNTPSR